MRDEFYKRLLKTALGKKGYAQQKTKRIERTGEYKPTWTFHGPIPWLDGTLTCYFWSTEIFAIDFVNKRVTDFGMRSYSISTGQNIGGWHQAIFRHFRRMLPEAAHEYGRWTTTAGNPTFRNHVKWLWKDWRGRYWFCWDKFDFAQAQAYHQGSVFLQKEQNWRYFEYDWDENGNWSRKFINEEAHRRWLQREEKSRAAYQEHLEQLLERGGTPAMMDAALKEYNALGNPDFDPMTSPAYRKWAGIKEPDADTGSRDQAPL